MKKKLYEKPTMEVVQLKHQSYLLQTSSDRDPYGDPIPGTWG